MKKIVMIAGLGVLFITAVLMLLSTGTQTENTPKKNGFSRQTFCPEPQPEQTNTVSYSEKEVDALARTVRKKKDEGDLNPDTIKLLARGTEEQVRTVIALTETSDVRRTAVEALGHVRLLRLHKDVEKQLVTLAYDADISVACSAVASLGKLRREAAIPHIERIIRDNYGGGVTGNGLRVCYSAVKALGEMGDKASLDALLKQLGGVNRRDWVYDYGSELIAALKRHDKRQGMGRFRSKDAEEEPGLSGKYREQIRDELLQYAGQLEKRLPGIPNRASRRYLESKIREAREASLLREAEAGHQ